MKARLVTFKNGKQDLAFPIRETRTGIGREPDNAVQLTDSEVSKHHAMIQVVTGGWELTDRGSTNGTFVNDRQVQRTTLKNQDQIRIGPFTMLFEIADDHAEWVASVVIDMSTNIDAKTMLNQKPK